MKQREPAKRQHAEVISAPQFPSSEHSDVASGKRRDTLFNFLLRLGVCLVTVVIHFTLFWPEHKTAVIAAAVFQGIIYSPLLHILPLNKKYRYYKLIIDSCIYGVCIAAWDFNIYLASFYLTAASGIAMAAAGLRLCVISVATMLCSASLAGLVFGWHFNNEIPMITSIVASSSLFVFITILGSRTFAITQRLRKIRSELRAQALELQNLNNLALAVNTHLDFDILMQSVMKTMESEYPFEALYILTFEEQRRKLEVTGIYGSSISKREHDAFKRFEFDIEQHSDSIFVSSLLEKKVAYLPKIEASKLLGAAKIDRDLYAVKPSVSMAYFPIYLNEVIIGGAGFLNYESYFTLDQSDIERIQQYLIQVGTAVRNTSLFKELELSKLQAEQAKQKAQASEGAKGRFLANMSHEIRTPLTSIMGYSEALSDAGIKAEERQRYIGHIQRSGDHLLSMINDILDISKIEAAKIEVEKISCNLVAILCDIESYVEIKCREKDLFFKMEITYPIPQYVYSDPTRLTQILLNLCNNAIKFTTQGGITIKLRHATSQTFEIIVEDTGIGLDEQEQQKIFTAFEQADSSTTRLYGGTGLGLYISKNLAILLGGDLRVTSHKSVGSQFIFTANIGAQNDQHIDTEAQFLEAMNTVKEAKTQAQTPLLSGTILVAEDNLENQLLITKLIQQTGASTEVVHDGKQAVEACSKKTYSLVLLDMQMPVMGGLEAAMRIKQAGVSSPLVAFTANVMKHQIDEYKQNGFAAVLEKPIDRSKLYEILQRFLYDRRKPLKQVLIAEDDEVNQLILQRYVKKYCPYAEITSVSNGRDAVKHTRVKDFDIILMDMQMPESTGLEATRLIREYNQTVPIYIVSGNVEKSDQRACFEAGASGHLAKPIVREDIKNIIIKHLVTTQTYVARPA